MQCSVPLILLMQGNVTQEKPYVILPETERLWTTLGYSRKNPKRGGRLGIYFLKTLLEFFIFYFTPGNPRQNKAQTLDIPQNC